MEKCLTILRRNKGLTLSMLVVTIIVLILIAGISISTLTGDNGVIIQAEQLKKEEEISKITETLKTKKMKMLVQNNKEIVTINEYIEEIENDDNIQYIVTDKKYIDEDNTYITIDDKYEYLLEQKDDGELRIIYEGKIKELPPIIKDVIVNSSSNEIKVEVSAKRGKNYIYSIKKQDEEDFTIIESENNIYTFEDLEDNEYTIIVEVVNEFGKDEEEIKVKIGEIVEKDKEPPVVTSIEIKNITATGYDVYLYGVTDNDSGVNRVCLQTWTEENGQDDRLEGKGTNKGNGTWYYRVNVTDHDSQIGIYNTKVYVYDNEENEKVLETKKVDVPGVKVTFDNNDGSSNKTIIEKGYNLELGTLPVPTRTGYTFKGWFTESIDGTQINETIKVPEVDITYYAQWTEHTYTIEFNANGGTGTMSSMTGLKYTEETTLIANEFTRSGYTFAGWNTKADGTGIGYNDKASVSKLSATNGETVTLYAVWTLDTYTISYTLNGGSVSTENPTSYNVTTSDITLNNPTREGYTFAGWTGSNGETAQTEVTIAKGSTGNKSYTANWTINKYYIDLNFTVDGTNYGSGGYDGRVKAGLKVAGVDKGYCTDHYVEYNYGTKWEIYGLELDGVRVPYTNSGTLGVGNADVRVICYTLNMAPNNTSYGAVSPTSLIVPNNNTTYETNGSKLTLSDGRTATATVTNATGYTTAFSSWSQENGTITSKTTVTANFTRTANTYTVTYNGNGATGGSTASSKHTYDIAKNLTANGYTREYTVTFNHNYTGSTNTTKTATYTFKNWNTKADGTGTSYANSASVTNLATSGTFNLYAQWNSASVTYVPTRTGYTFAGWYAESACTTSKAGTNGIFTPTANITLYAKWTVNTYTVTYNYSQNEGTSATKTSSSVSYNTAIDLTPTATKSGYEFVGWNTNKDATTKLDSLTMGTENVTLYAIYSKTITGIFNYYNGQSTKVSKTIYNTTTQATINAPEIENQTVSSVEYTGRGWSTSTDSNATVNVNSGASLTLSTDATYYASYQATIIGTFYYSTIAADTLVTSNGAQSSATATAIRYMGYKGEYKQSEFTVPTEVIGSTGGTTAENYAGVSTSVNSATLSTPTTANTKFYAVYTEKFTLYYYNGTTHTSKAIVRRMLSNGTTYANSLAEPEPTPAAYDGASFVAWSYSQSQYSSSYRRTLLGTGSNALYAIYQKTISITYDANGGTGVPSEDTGTKTYISKSGGVNTYNPTITLSSTKPTRTGYTFIGWYDAKSEGTKIGDAGATYIASTDKTIYARWTLNEYTISYNTNMEYEQYQKQAGFTITQMSENDGDFYRASFTKNSGTTDEWKYIKFPHYEYEVGETYIIRMKIRMQTVSNCSAVIRHSSISNDYGTSGRKEVNFTSGTTGQWIEYTLSRTITSSTTTQNSITYTVNPLIEIYTSNLALTDTVTSRSLTFDFKDVYVEKVTTQKKSYGETLGTLELPTRTGYTFEGWFTDRTSGTQISESTQILYGDITYYAHWKANTNTAYKVIHQQMGLDGTTYTTVETENKTGTTNTLVIPSVKSYTGFTAPSTQTVTIAADGSTTITYKYTRNKYTFTLGTASTVTTIGSTASGSYYYRETINLKATANTGYTWSKWTSSNTNLVANKETASTTFTMPAGALTMTPSATLNTYTISYTLNGGSVATANPTSYNVTTSDITLNNPTKTGYAFAGWTEKISTSKWYSGFININTGALENSSSYPNSVYSEPIFIKANVQYTISGTSLGGIRWRIFNTDGSYRGNLSSSTSYTPTTDCYVRVLLYEGCTETNRNAMVITSSVGTTVTIEKGSTGNRSYTANWTANTYTVSYNKGTATGGTLPSNQTATYNASITLGTNNMTKSNTNLGTVTFNYNGSGASNTTSTAQTKYTANGWTTTSGSQTRNYTNGQEFTYTKTSGLTLYPCFTQTAVSATFPTPTRTGYTFAGWYTAASGGTKVTSYTGSSNVTYYAHWTENTYTIAFNANGGTGTMSSITGVKYTAATTLTANTFTREGYTFAGWATSANGSKTYDNKASVSKLTSTAGGTVTLYAVWIDDIAPSKPTITAKLGSSSGSSYTSGNWTNKNIYVTLSSSDVNGITKYEWKEGSSGTWKTTWLTTSNNVGTITYTGNRNSTIYFRATDGAGNISEENSIVIRKETTAPTVTITTSPSENPTSASSITYTFTWSEEVTGFTVDDITVTNGTKGTFIASSSTVYTLVVTNSQSCTQTVSVASGICIDKAGNSNTEAEKSVTVEKIAGKVTLSATSGTVTYPSTKTFTVTENISGGTLSVSSSNTSVATVSISGTTITITPKVLTSDGQQATITVTSAAKGDYKEAKATYTATVNRGTIGLNVTSYSGAYDGSAHNAITINNVHPADAKLEYALNDGSYSTTIPTVKDIGTYTVSIRVSKTGYVTKEITKTVTVAEPVAKVGTTNYASVTEAIESISNSGTVVMLKNSTESITIPSGKTINLNTDEYTLTGQVTNNGTLNVSGGGKITGATPVVTNAGTFTVTNVTITQGGASGYHAIVNTGNLTVNSGTISASAGSVDNSGSATIVGGTFSSAGHCIKNQSAGEMEITGGTFSAPINNIGLMNISGGTFNQFLQNSGTANITGGTFKTSTYVLNNQSGATLNISNGTFTTTSTSTSGYGCLKNYGTATLEGGTYTSNKSECLYNYSGGILNIRYNATFYSSGYNGLINYGTTNFVGSGTFKVMFNMSSSSSSNISNYGTLNVNDSFVLGLSVSEEGITNYEEATIYISSNAWVGSYGTMISDYCSFAIYNYGKVTNMGTVAGDYYAYYNSGGSFSGPASSKVIGHHN